MSSVPLVTASPTVFGVPLAEANKVSGVGRGSDPEPGFVFDVVKSEPSPAVVLFGGAQHTGYTPVAVQSQDLPSQGGCNRVSEFRHIF